MAQSESVFRITIDTPYLPPPYPPDDLWCVDCEDLGENGPRYKDTVLYYKDMLYYAH